MALLLSCALRRVVFLSQCVQHTASVGTGVHGEFCQRTAEIGLRMGLDPSPGDDLIILPQSPVKMTFTVSSNISLECPSDNWMLSSKHKQWTPTYVASGCELGPFMRITQ